MLSPGSNEQKVRVRNIHAQAMKMWKDTVLLRQFEFNTHIAGFKQPQNLLLDLNLNTDFDKASKMDDLNYSINYATLSRDIKEREQSKFNSLLDIGNTLFDDIVFKKTSCENAILKMTLKQSNYDYRLQLDRSKGEERSITKVLIQNLKLDVIIGIFTFERFQTQPIEVNIELDLAEAEAGIDMQLPQNILDYTKNTNFKTVEAFVLNVTKLVYQLCPLAANVKVRVLKTNIIEYTQVGVQCERTALDVENYPLVEFNQSDITTESFHLPNLNNETTIQQGDDHIVYLAFGSNLGNQLRNINIAMNELNSHDQIEILQTSSLYKSKPMYYLDQDDFINGCLKIKTSLTPHELLKVCKSIEYESLKRIKHFDNGPRSIDLDILLYDQSIVNTPDLNIPHIDMIHRNFVLYPLCDLLPPTFVHPVTAETIHSHLDQLKPSDKSIQESSKLTNIIPLLQTSEDFKYLEFDLINNQTETKLMSILNVTPDSFSDGSKANLDLENIMHKVEKMVANGVDIIDIGGCSTRPGSIQPPLQDELDRVLPVVKSIKAKYGDSIIISVDTYRSKVAEESIKLGCDIINDISGGSFDEEMYDVIAKYDVTYIINHTRGNISNMNSLTDYQGTENDSIEIFDPKETIINEIGKELSDKISLMYTKGIKRWQLILDPGLGFAKGLHENLNIIRNLPHFKEYQQLKQDRYISFKYIPVLVGPSRKKFIGTITKKQTAVERLNGTSASITASIGFGSDIVRVHDYKEMKDVCLMGDAIYKNLF